MVRRIDRGYSKKGIEVISMIGTSDIHKPEPERPLINLKSLPQDKGIDAL